LLLEHGTLIFSSKKSKNTWLLVLSTYRLSSVDRVTMGCISQCQTAGKWLHDWLTPISTCLATVPIDMKWFLPRQALKQQYTRYSSQSQKSSPLAYFTIVSRCKMMAPRSSSLRISLVVLCFCSKGPRESS
ncbi:hypothetical protein H0H93_004585, partial [Arthromyces matolae]